MTRAGATGGRRADVLDALGRRIVTGELAPGTVLTLEAVDATYGVSRSVSREAVQVLGSMGLVSARRRVGITVGPRSAWNVFDPRVVRWRLDGPERDAQLRSIGELRAGFEPSAAALAATRASAPQVAALAAAVADMTTTARARDLEAYLQADQLFHQTLLAAAGNEMYAALAPLVDEALAGRTHHDLMPEDPEPEAIEWHAQVADAVRRGDADAAEEAMRRIVVEAREASAARAAALAALGSVEGSVEGPVEGSVEASPAR